MRHTMEAGELARDDAAYFDAIRDLFRRNSRGGKASTMCTCLKRASPKAQRNVLFVAQVQSLEFESAELLRSADRKTDRRRPTEVLGKQQRRGH